MQKDLQLLILPNELKKEFLKKRNQEGKLNSLKLMTLQEFIEKITYTYSNETIYYVMKTYHVKEDIAKTYLENTYYVEEKTYQNEKLNFLVKLKKELKEKKLLKEDTMFQNYIQTHKVGVLGYPYLERYEKSILDTYHVQEIPFDLPKEERIIPCYACNTMEEEIAFVANEIRNLYEKGIPFSKIKLMNVNQDYYHAIQKIFGFYHIPYEKPKESIYGTLMSHAFLDHLNLPKEELWEFLETHFTNKETIPLKEQLQAILNHYTWCENLEEVRELIEKELKETFLEEPSFEESVELLPFELFKDSECYVFLIGCNQGILPKIYQDEEFITDSMKNEVPLSTTTEKNKLFYLKAIYQIEQLPNLIISYKLNTPFEEYLPSSILRDLKVEEIKPENKSFLHYSKLYDALNYAKELDDFYKYGTMTKTIPIYQKTFSSFPYLSYQNDFTGISKEALFERLKNHLTLSYTALDSYYRCPFRYYVSRILKCDPYEETFPLFIGNLFHSVLKNAFQENFDFEKEWNVYLKNSNRSFSFQEQFFLTRLKKELLFDIETIQKQNQEIGLKQQLHEEEVFISYKEEIPVNLKGIIDKIYYDEVEGKLLSSIVDYKTGVLHTDFSSILYGVNMQLPIYYYLLKHHSKMKDASLIGFYLQKIVSEETVLKERETRECQKEKSLRFVGYSTNKENLLKQFDSNYQESTLIKGMKVGKNGFYSTAKVLSDKELQTLYNIVEKNIQNGISSILKGEFPIHPKVIGTENKGCENCPYSDLCFKKERDKIYLKEQKDFKFLEEGENNA